MTKCQVAVNFASLPFELDEKLLCPRHAFLDLREAESVAC